VDILVEARLEGEDGLILIHVKTKPQRLPDCNRSWITFYIAGGFRQKQGLAATI